MPKRFVSIWFRHLLTDWKTIRQPDLKGKPVVFVRPDHGRMVVTASNAIAEKFGISEGIVVADAKAMCTELEIFDHKPGRSQKLLSGLADWCLRFTPAVMIDPPDGLLLDATGCTHIWGGEEGYLREVINRLKEAGYDARPGMAETIGCAWGVARCANTGLIVPEGSIRTALIPLPPSALRLDTDLLIKLNNLGLYQIGSFIHMPRSVLRRRFGQNMVLRLLQALGQEEEFLLPIREPVQYSERLSCLEPIKTRTAIEIALQKLLETLCKRLCAEGKGLRIATFSYYRIDSKSGQLTIGTNHPTHHSTHLFKLFEMKLDEVAPGLGIELFVLDASKVEDVAPEQEMLWASSPGLNDKNVAELLDRLSGKIGGVNIHRFLPSEHFWPERNTADSSAIDKNPDTFWRTDKPRPFQLLSVPEPIEATALTPDYPPILFIYKGKKHDIKKADGPERIEREWWLEPGEHRDYYIAEDQDGKRYWLFRSGHYSGTNSQHWYIHGFFA